MALQILTLIYLLLICMLSWRLLQEDQHNVTTTLSLPHIINIHLFWKKTKHMEIGYSLLFVILLLCFKYTFMKWKIFSDLEGKTVFTNSDWIGCYLRLTCSFVNMFKIFHFCFLTSIFTVNINRQPSTMSEGLEFFLGNFG